MGGSNVPDELCVMYIMFIAINSTNSIVRS